MIPQPARLSAFPRSTRAIHADSLAPGLAILIIVMLLLLAWLLWLMLFRVPFYQTSQSAHVTPDALVVAVFSPDVLAQIQSGQAALFVPTVEPDGVSAFGGALTATVVEIDPDSGQVWLLLTADRATQSQLYPDLSGQVRVVVREQSPLSLILEAVGMNLSV